MLRTAYRIVCKTVAKSGKSRVIATECETVYDTQEVSRQVPVWETEMRERRFKVLQPRAGNVDARRAVLRAAARV